MMWYLAWLFRVLCSRRYRSLHTAICLLLVTTYLVIYTATKSNKVSTNTVTTCHERTSFVYVKMIKCASTTLNEVFRRFGFQRHLSFVLPSRKHIYIGWPYPVDDTFYQPPKSANGRFDILCDHAVYDAVYFEKIMSPDVVFITSLREPFAQFKSMVNYYNVLNISTVPVNVSDRFNEYLTHLEHYETVYKSHEAAKLRYCVPDGFSMTRNLMAFNLGYPTGGFMSLADDRANDDASIQRWISVIDDKFLLVIIVEYFHESMVLLRRLMCWQLVDILFKASNSLFYNYKHQVNERLKVVYEHWSRVDFLLYQHFNKTLWNKIHLQDASFWDEVTYFRRINTEVNDFCKHLNSTESTKITIEKSTWTSEFTVTHQLCSLMATDLLDQLQVDYDRQQTTFNISDKQPSIVTC